MLKSAVIIDLNCCKNSCLFCNPQRLIKSKVCEKDLKNIEIKLLRQAGDLYKKGLNRYVEISGSDPIEYRKIAPFINYLKNELKCGTVMLSTHGRDLHNEKLVKDLKRAGLDELRIPLYGSTATVHDSVTQERGSFKETLKGIKNIVKHAPAIKMKISSLIMKQNHRDLLKTFNLANEYASEIMFSIPCISNLRYAQKFALPFEKIRNSLLSLLALSEKTEKPFSISDIPFCVFGFFRKNIINLTGPPATSSAYSIPDVYKSGIANLPNYRVKRRLRICDSCYFRFKCDGFFNNYLDLFGVPPFKPLKTGNSFRSIRETVSKPIGKVGLQSKQDCLLD